jgi:CheY-like chemotaxis protein
MILSGAEMHGDDEKIPPMGHPSWEARVAPLKAFLASPRTWADLEAWRRMRGVNGWTLRSMLAWLSCRGLADARPSSEGWKWSRVRVRNQSSKEVEAMGTRVLVVEDDEDSRTLLQESLTEAGLDVQTAANGWEALTVLTETVRAVGPPDIILLDVDMPIMNGKEFRRHQLATPFIAKIPTIVMSGTVSVDYVTEMRPTGTLPKPFLMKDLYALLSRHTAWKASTERRPG